MVPDADGIPHWYWYLPYTVVNRTGADRMFVPEVLVVNEEGATIHGGQNVPATVFAAVKHDLNRRYLVDPMHVVGKLLQGEDNAVDSVVIWPAPATASVQMRIFFTGLSGETVNIAAPDGGTQTTLRKTLMLEYQTPGKPATPTDQPVLFESATWVMR
jgi:hypothetical protein